MNTASMLAMYQSYRLTKPGQSFGMWANFTGRYQTISIVVNGVEIYMTLTAKGIALTMENRLTTSAMAACVQPSTTQSLARRMNHEGRQDKRAET